MLKKFRKNKKTDLHSEINHLKEVYQKVIEDNVEYLKTEKNLELLKFTNVCACFFYEK